MSHLNSAYLLFLDCKIVAQKTTNTQNSHDLSLTLKLYKLLYISISPMFLRRQFTSKWILCKLFIKYDPESRQRTFSKQTKFVKKGIYIGSKKKVFSRNTWKPSLDEQKTVQKILIRFQEKNWMAFP